MRGVRSYRFLAAEMAFLVLTLGGCGQADLPSDLSNNMESANAYIDDLVAGLPEDARADYQRRAAEIEQNLARELDQASAGQYKTANLGDYADRRLGTISHLKDNIETITRSLGNEAGDAPAQQSPELDEFARNSLKVQLAVALKERALNQHYLDLAGQKDKVVAEAVQRWRGLPEPKSGRVSDLVRDLAWEPCAFLSDGKVADGRFTMEGVALGMKRDEAIAALCAAHRSDVRMATAPSSAMTHWIAWRDTGFDDGTTLKELPWTTTFPYTPSNLMGPIRQQLSRSFESGLNFCFGCAQARPGQSPGMQAGFDNGLSLRLLPNGHVAGITRAIRFSPDEGSGNVTPKPLGEALAPFQAKFGKPSFLYEAGVSPMIGWVFPQGTNPLPGERWFATWDKAQWRLDLHFGRIGLAEGANRMIDTVKLAAQRPFASYCLTRHFQLRNVSTGLPGYPYDDRRQAAEIYLASGGKSDAGRIPFRYDTRFESPAFVDRCGVVILATIRRDPRNDGNTLTNEERAAPLDGKTPVYTMTITMLDTNAIRDSFVREEQQVYAQAPANVKNPPAIEAPARTSGLARDAVMGLAQKGRSDAYAKWMTCLYARLHNRFEPQDEARCQHLNSGTD